MQSLQVSSQEKSKNLENVLNQRHVTHEALRIIFGIKILYLP